MNIIRDYLVELQKYLPEFLRNDPELNAILEVESKEHRVQVEVLKDILNQFFIDTATWGLSDFERNLGLKPSAGDDYTQRRNRILIYLQQHKTVNKAFIEELFSRYVSADAKIEVVEDNPENTFWVIDTGGRILYPDDLREAIETYKPAHLRYGLEMRREIHMNDEESKIRIGIASMFEGYSKISVYMPNGVHNPLTVAAIPAGSGVVKIGVGRSEDEKFTVKQGNITGLFGKRELDFDKSDLPEVFAEKDSYVAPTVGLVRNTRGVKTIYPPLPEDEVFKIGFAAQIASAGIQRFGLDPPKKTSSSVSVGVKITRSGERRINASESDLPEIFKERDSYIAPKFGITTMLKSKKRIGVYEPTKEGTTSKAGFYIGAVSTGYRVIDADLSVLTV